MSAEPGEPRFGRWELPPVSRAVWTAVLASVVSYFVVGRALANLVAVVGGVVVTAIIIMREQAKP